MLVFVPAFKFGWNWVIPQKLSFHFLPNFLSRLQIIQLENNCDRQLCLTFPLNTFFQGLKIHWQWKSQKGECVLVLLFEKVKQVIDCKQVKKKKWFLNWSTVKRREHSCFIFTKLKNSWTLKKMLKRFWSLCGNCLHPYCIGCVKA